MLKLKNLKLVRHLHVSHNLYLTSNPLLCFVSLSRFTLWLFGGSDPICRSTLHCFPTGGLKCLCWGLGEKLACGCGSSGFTSGRLLAELEAAGELFMLMGRDETIAQRFELSSTIVYYGQLWVVDGAYSVTCGVCFVLIWPLEPPLAQWALLSPPWTGWYVRQTG